MPSPRTVRPGLAELTERLGILYGGDYNPEQWTPEIWAEDARLMQDAGVNLASVGIFSWASLEPEPGRFTFGWLEQVIDLLADHGVAIDLATPTASPPPWLGHRWPDTLPVTAEGVRLGWGSRNHYCPSSPVYRERSRLIVAELLRRFGDHPAVAMWHVGNEYGTPCYCDQCAVGFRGWLQARYQDLDALNAAWGTAFWSQRYSEWAEIIPPRQAPYLINPSQQLDFHRFVSDLLLEGYLEQRSMIIDANPLVPVTTNLMRFYWGADYRTWAPHLDVIADDVYPDPNDPRSIVEASLTSDLMRSLGHTDDGQRGWMLLEQAAGAVNWRGHNVAKSVRRTRLESLRAIGRGAGGSCYFQWRASTAGTERFHAALVPHAGEDSDRWRAHLAHGQELKALSPAVQDEEVTAEVAMIFDWDSWWAAEEPAVPSNRLKPLEQLQAWYTPLWRAGVTADIVASTADLSGYRVVLAPTAYLLTDDATANLQNFVAAGGTLVLGPFSGVADSNGHVRRGRFPVDLTDVIGASGEQWLPLPDAHEVVVTSELLGDGPVRVWSEQLRAEGAEIIATFAGWPVDGLPAVVRNDYQQGTAWYLATLPEDAWLAQLITAVLDEAGVRPVLAELPDQVEAVRRGELVFVINHKVEDVVVTVPGRWRDLLTDTLVGDQLELPGEDVAVLRPIDGGEE
ncbi:beta-galactosidase [Microlunatus endophyticus]|uniref:Beta-galactosidase n=1 Tax=Microlunatus endophyticus TaxID=1716077 RepID=A0A917S7R7_9ACTN|nr:beta-galactosidase [Microlunatus endophyticus]GGL62554.1 beta-galactosidase [Microlunatus endophyticus]